MRVLPSLLLPALLSFAACGATNASMPYAPTVAVQPATPARPLVGMPAPVANERRTGREDPTWIGTIRGGYGNPLKVLHADRPVDQVVGRTFADGLAARGLQAEPGREPRYVLSVVIHQFDANQYARRKATADFGLVLTGREVWRDRHRAYNVDGSLVSLNAFAFGSIEDLRAVALRTMSETVDVLLDKPGFRAALQG